MRLKRNISRAISDLSSVIGKFKRPRYGFRVLMYHSINTLDVSNLSADPLRAFTVHPEVFKRHVHTLIESSSISLVSFRDGWKSIPQDSRSVAITFDDGFNDNLYTAAPILVELGIPFTVFITTMPVIKRIKGYLIPSEITELSKLPGVEIGTHGVTHTKLTELGDKDLTNELVTSKHYLEDIIGKEIQTISYPHGAIDLRVKEAVARAGYLVGGDSRFGVNTCAQDPLVLRRTVIMSLDSKQVFKQKIQGDWDWYASAEPKYRKLELFFQKRQIN